MKYTKRNGIIINSWKKRLALQWMQPISHEDYLRAASGEALMTLTGLRAAQEALLRKRGYVFSHTLENQIGGQLRAGFILKDILEDVDDDGKLGEHNIPTSILTRAVKSRADV